MRRISLFLLSFVVLGTVSVCAQGGNSAAPDWENPRVFGINKEPARASFTPFADETAAMSADKTSTLVVSLNGAWKFHWVKSPDLRPADFYKPEFDASSWKEIPVPSN